MLTKQILSTACALLAGTSLFGGPLEKTKVDRDAKWVVHLDVEAFRAAKIGNHVIETVVQPKLDEMEAVKKMNLSINLQNISSLTAYGTEFGKNGEGVLLLSTTADVKKDLDGLVGMSSLSANEKKDFTLLGDAGYALYSLKDGVFFAPGVNNTVLIAKSREQIERAREVVLGKVANIAKSSSFNDYPEAANTFFFLGMAEGFNENTKIPPQAQVLRETKGGRLVLGEKEQKVFLNLIFKGKDDESTTKIQQVLQGLLALVTMTQQDKDITELAGATKISGDGKSVNVSVQVPVSRVISHMDGHVKHQRKQDRAERTEPEEKPEESEPKSK